MHLGGQQRHVQTVPGHLTQRHRVGHLQARAAQRVEQPVDGGSMAGQVLSSSSRAPAGRAASTGVEFVRVGLFRADRRDQQIARSDLGGGRPGQIETVVVQTLRHHQVPGQVQGFRRQVDDAVDAGEQRKELSHEHWGPDPLSRYG